jgi:hypothetical protein
MTDDPNVRRCSWCLRVKPAGADQGWWTGLHRLTPVYAELVLLCPQCRKDFRPSGFLPGPQL